MVRSVKNMLVWLWSLCSAVLRAKGVCVNEHGRDSLIIWTPMKYQLSFRAKTWYFHMWKYHDRCITSGGGPASFKNLFSPSGRVESAGLILAHCCGSIGLDWLQTKTCQNRSCRPCGRKIRNAAQLNSFIKRATRRGRFTLRGCGRSKEKTASHYYHARKKRCKNETSRIWRWTAERKKVLERLILERPCLQKARELLVLKHFIHTRLSK